MENILINAMLEVFSSMVFIEITAEPAEQNGTTAMEYNLVSLIGLAGDLKGILAIQCPGAVAMGITEAMLGMEVSELDGDVKDAIGEISNMVAGGLKEGLLPAGKKIELAIPTTVIGTNVRTSGLSGASRLLIPFTCPLGRFGIELRYILS